MIIQPNFLDHWKTRMLVVELGGDEFAPLYLLRLWGHCQEQKEHRFPKLSAAALAGICHFKGAPGQLWLAMQTAGFILLKGTTVEVHQWKDYNAGLISAWENGKKGGRKKNRPVPPTDNRNTVPDSQKGTDGAPDREDSIDSIDEIGGNSNTPPAEAGGEGKKQRPRNLLMDELATICGIPLAEIGQAVAKRLNAVLTTIKQSTPDVTPDEIRRRAANYPSHMRDAVLTPEALAKHWGVCNAQGTATRQSTTKSMNFADE